MCDFCDSIKAKLIDHQTNTYTEGRRADVR